MRLSWQRQKPDGIHQSFIEFSMSCNKLISKNIFINDFPLRRQINFAYPPTWSEHCKGNAVHATTFARPLSRPHQFEIAPESALCLSNMKWEIVIRCYVNPFNNLTTTPLKLLTKGCDCPSENWFLPIWCQLPVLYVSPPPKGSCRQCWALMFKTGHRGIPPG